MTKSYKGIINGVHNLGSLDDLFAQLAHRGERVVDNSLHVATVAKIAMNLRHIRVCISCISKSCEDFQDSSLFITLLMALHASLCSSFS